MAAAMPASLLFFFLLLLCKPTPSSSSIHSPFYNYQTLVSLTHSLFDRVANHRAARGDAIGAARARSVAGSIERGLGLGFWKLMLNLGWDYARNYAWRDATSFEMLGAVSDLNELLGALGELTRFGSDAERVAWVSGNYRNVLRISKNLSGKLLKVFRQSGPLRDVMETVQKEVWEGDLLKDCLELGGNDLKGLIQVLKAIALQFTSTSSTRRDDL
ncbi:unnamed protein product [Cuscuta campestris]|uniref:Pectinesterase inhibitor domain-containing protein n=1 Tax=Cuscuta campestris TaxID=132261 RepID=A0A484MHH6_9ASTE|nr:unnamed protein product [Cuscuta campestris]